MLDALSGLKCGVRHILGIYALLKVLVCNWLLLKCNKRYDNLFLKFYTSDVLICCLMMECDNEVWRTGSYDTW